ncbi:hypothetical protein Mal15_49380 [Stieleria maiorica]|uniref:Uncharacterized protein n=1 Tax=Stieleria maiorica TaxID=2795974 RepID=A0A5B9MHT7_9BACT|nr:hypothetical protein Mal15_49380 [Stieleria maiorica]
MRAGVAGGEGDIAGLVGVGEIQTCHSDGLSAKEDDDATREGSGGRRWEERTEKWGAEK